MTPDPLLEFWFADGPDTERKQWFIRDATFDDELRSRFGSWLPVARAGGLDGWATTPTGALALIILLDQLSRNIHRGSPESFAGDARALALAQALVQAGDDQRLTPMQRLFAYLPFEHSEALADQDRSVALFESLGKHPGMASFTDYAHRHRDVVARFGRFPHRNAALGRASTPAEVAYLAQPGAGF